MFHQDVHKCRNSVGIKHKTGFGLGSDSGYQKMINTTNKCTIFN